MLSKLNKILETKSLTKRFGGLLALSKVDLEVLERQIYAVIGPNGAGKTTLFNVINGFYFSDEGQVFFDGVDISRLEGHLRTRMGMARTFQDLRFFGKMTAWETVTVGYLSRTKHGYSSLLSPLLSKEAYREIEDLLVFMGIQNYRNETVVNLPLGDQRRVDMARALACNPRLILLDEPVSGMTPGEMDTVAEAIRRIQGSGITVIVVEHNVSFIMSIADRVAVLNFGHKIADGIPQEIQQNSEVREAYLGSE